MKNITDKTTTLRTANAHAIVKVSDESTITAVKEKKVPKGDIFEMSKAAGLLAAKRTSDMIPDCHPIPIEYASVLFEISGLEIIVNTEVQAIYRTGVEVEAMHMAAIVALTIYDMLKPLDDSISIEHIRLIKKKGGETDYLQEGTEQLKSAIIVCSDSISKGVKQDRAGKAIIQKLEKYKVQLVDYIIIPDDAEEIKKSVLKYCAQNINMVILTGGTGLSPRDATPEVLNAIIERRIPGIEEAIRSYGQQRTPYSMLSRSVSGLIGNTLVLALPGSTRGAKESMDAVVPGIFHLFHSLRGGRHD